jgi:hypothetical protein
VAKIEFVFLSFAEFATTAIYVEQYMQQLLLAKI